MAAESSLAGQTASSRQGAGEASRGADGRKLSSLQEIKGERLEHLASAQDEERQKSGEAHAF